ncbi:MAG TPA: response regulator [Bryobacteraceae bacterium]
MPQDDKPEIKRVLVVDDHPGVLNALADALKLLGFEVFTATSGRGISEIVSASSIDLLITDLGMPDEDGIEIVRRMRLEYPELKIIVVSGTFGLEMFKAARLLGANATLSKPVRVAELRDCIRRISAN